MNRDRFGTMHCSMARALDVIGDPWTPLVVRDLYLGLTRFDELADDLGVARNLLTRRLDHLVDGVSSSGTRTRIIHPDTTIGSRHRAERSCPF